MRNIYLFYDDQCPFCSWTADKMIKLNLISAQEALPYSRENEFSGMIDPIRGRNEVPMVERATGKLYYGTEALVHLFTTDGSFSRKFLSFRPIFRTLDLIYKTFSFNRRLIFARNCGNKSYYCEPEFNLFYQVLFMAFCLTLNTLLLFPIHEGLFSSLEYYDLSQSELQAAHFSLAGINCVLGISLGLRKGIEYLAQVNMLAFTVIILLLPATLLNYLVDLPGWFNTIYLVLTAIVIFREYVRRMEYADMILKRKWIVSLNLATLTGFVMYLFG